MNAGPQVHVVKVPCGSPAGTVWTRKHHELTKPRLQSILRKVSISARIAREREAARTLSRQIAKDMEAYLLGTKRVAGAA